MDRYLGYWGSVFPTLFPDKPDSTHQEPDINGYRVRGEIQTIISKNRDKSCPRCLLTGISKIDALISVGNDFLNFPQGSKPDLISLNASLLFLWNEHTSLDWQLCLMGCKVNGFFCSKWVLFVFDENRWVLFLMSVQLGFWWNVKWNMN